MYQNPPRFPPVPPPPETPPRRRRRLVPFVVLLALFALLFFGGSYVVSPEPDIEVRPGLAFAEVDGRDVVLVPYERHGTGGMVVRVMYLPYDESDVAVLTTLSP